MSYIHVIHLPCKPACGCSDMFQHIMVDISDGREAIVYREVDNNMAELATSWKLRKNPVKRRG